MTRANAPLTEPHPSASSTARPPIPAGNSAPRLVTRSLDALSQTSPKLMTQKLMNRSTTSQGPMFHSLMALALLLVGLASAPVLAAEPELPGDSLFHLDVSLLNQNGKDSKLADLRGKPFMVTLIYASCPSACPMLIQDMKRIEKALPEDVRKELSVVVVSFDPKVDTPEVLMDLAKRQKVELPRWQLAAAPSDEVADLANVLGVKYRQLEDGHWAHSSVISVVDSEGVIRGRYEGYLRTVDEPANTVRAVVAAAKARRQVKK